MQNKKPTVYISEIYCYIVKSTNPSTILQFCTKNMKKFKNIVLSWQPLCASLRSVLVPAIYARGNESISEV
jgi:hypothetical protein